MNDQNRAGSIPPATAPAVVGATLQEQAIASAVLRILANNGDPDMGSLFSIEIKPDIDHPQDWLIDVGVVYTEDDGSASEHTFRSTIDPFGNEDAIELN